MANASQRRFADEQGIPLGVVVELAYMADECCDANTHECNGDPYPGIVPMDDKNRNAKYWGMELERLTQELRAAVEPYGLTVEFTGLRPCLRDRAGRYIEIPHAE